MNGGAVRAARLLVCLVLLPCSASAASLRDRLRASPLTVGIPGGPAFAAPTANRLRYGLKIHSNIGSLSLTYGLLDNLDVNLLLPVIDTDFAVGVQSQVIAMALPGGGFSAAPEPLRIGRTQGNAVGIGDILL